MADKKIKAHLNQKIDKLNSALDDQRKIREESEEQLVQLIKEMMAKLKSHIEGESRERE